MIGRTLEKISPDTQPDLQAQADKREPLVSSRLSVLGAEVVDAVVVWRAYGVTKLLALGGVSVRSVASLRRP